MSRKSEPHLLLIIEEIESIKSRVKQESERTGDDLDEVISDNAVDEPEDEAEWTTGRINISLGEELTR